MKVTLIFIWMMACYQAHGQGRAIKGLVQSEGKQPLPGVSIILKDDSARIIAFALTGKKGNFSIGPVTEEIGTYIIEFRHIGYEARRVQVNTPKDLGRDELIIEMAEKPVELKEIVIRRELPVLIRSDTVVFNANSYRDPEVKKVEDLLKKMQGFTVDASGRLSFNGRQVEKVLVDGDDLAGDGYQMVTKNLNAITIDKVEVIHNFSDNRLLRNFSNNEKVGVNLKISSRFKAKLSGSGEAGLSFEDRYNVDANAVYISKGFKWLAFGNANNIAHEVSGNAKHYYQQEGGQLGFEEGSPAGVPILENGELVMPFLGDRYTRDNKDLGSAIMNSWKLGKYNKFNAMIGYDDLRSVNLGSGSVHTRISEVEQWLVKNKMLLSMNSRDLVGRISLHRDPGKKQVTRIDLVTNKGRRENGLLNFSSGDVNDSLKERLKDQLRGFRLKAQHTWLMGDKVLQGNLVLDKGEICQDMDILSSRFLSFWMLDSSYRLNRQHLNKRRIRSQLHLKVNGKTRKIQYEYGVITDLLKTLYNSLGDVESVSGKPEYGIDAQERNLKSVSLRGVFKLQFDLGKASFLAVQGNSGIESIYIEGKNNRNFVYDAGIGYMRKFGLMNSLRLNYKLSRNFRKYDQVYPDQLMSGSSRILNGLRFEGPETSQGFVSTFSGNNIAKQRTWSGSLSYILMPQRYVYGVNLYPEYLLQNFELGADSRMINASFNMEAYIRFLQSKIGGLVNFYSGKDNSSVNGLKGSSVRHSLKIENWWITGFRLPLNAECRFGLSYSEGNWNGGESNSFWLYNWSHKVKWRLGKKFYSSLTWNGQKLIDQRAFHGLDLYVSYKLSSSLQLLCNGINLLNVGRIADVVVMPYSRSENSYTLVGRYILLSGSFSF